MEKTRTGSIKMTSKKKREGGGQGKGGKTRVIKTREGEKTRAMRKREEMKTRVIKARTGRGSNGGGGRQGKQRESIGRTPGTKGK